MTSSRSSMWYMSKSCSTCSSRALFCVCMVQSVLCVVMLSRCVQSIPPCRRYKQYSGAGSQQQCIGTHMFSHTHTHIHIQAVPCAQPHTHLDLPIWPKQEKRRGRYECRPSSHQRARHNGGKHAHAFLPAVYHIHTQPRGWEAGNHEGKATERDEQVYANDAVA